MVSFDDMKRAWQSESGISQEQFDQIGDRVREGTTLLQSTIFRRDMVETFASIVVAAFFTPGLFTAKNLVAWSGFAIIVLACITIPFVFWRARTRPIDTVSSANFCDFVDIEIDYLRRQVQLLRTVAWWYLLPLYVGLILVTVGATELSHGSLFEMIFVAILVALCTSLLIYIWWLNQAKRKTQLEPLLDYYVEMRSAVEGGDDFTLHPPPVFLQQKPREPMSRRQRSIWILLTCVFTALAAGAGVATMQYFDRRAGLFVASTAPVIAFLVIYVSGIWRRDSV